MYFSERQDMIVRILKDRKSASVHYLAQQLHASEPTIRRDLAYLAKLNFIHRTFGGAVINQQTTTEAPFQMRERSNTTMKDVIARKACRHLSNDMVIFIDASSTASRLLRLLPMYSGLTVITNSPQCSLMLAELKIRSFCTGGYMQEGSMTYVGSSAEEFVRNFNADVCFFSCRGITNDGQLSHSSIEEVNIKRVMMEQSKKNVFLCTSEKIGKSYMYNLCKLSSVDDMISEIELPKSLEAMLSPKGE